jgi:hypothetical protein
MSAQTQNVAAEFAVEVKRKTHSDGTETWRASVKADGSRFSAVSEQALRETLRAHLVRCVQGRRRRRLRHAVVRPVRLMGRQAVGHRLRNPDGSCRAIT